MNKTGGTFIQVKKGTLLTTPTRTGPKGKQSELVTKQIDKKLKSQS